MGKIPFTNEIKLDFDEHKGQRLDVKRIGWIAKFCRLTVEDVKAWRTAHGIHIRINTREKLHPLVVVLIQSLMGSDYKRETYDACRVLNIMKHPERYSETAKNLWNVLYYKKLVGRRVVSKERFDPKLTKKLKKELVRKELVENGLRD
jgi:hypothetical protein